VNLALSNRGFGEYSGIVSPDNTKFIVNIPKNASSYVLDWTVRSKWKTAVVTNNTWPDLKEIIVVLRDPLSRWVSGMSQYLKTYILCPIGPNGPVYPGMMEGAEDYVMTADDFIALYNQSTERLIFDNVFRFDDHVWPQHDFYEHIRPNLPRRYFMLDRNFDVNFASGLGLEFIDNLDRNDGSANADIKKLHEFLQHRLNTRPELCERVQRVYARDYEIIKQVFNQ
jgi:hypothetical protein